MVDHYMAIFDNSGNPDDKISLDEYKKGINDMAEAAGVTLTRQDMKRCEREFRRADHDNSGFVDRAELKAALGY